MVFLYEVAAANPIKHTPPMTPRGLRAQMWGPMTLKIGPDGRDDEWVFGDC